MTNPKPTRLSRLRELSKSSMSQSFVSIEAYELSDLLDVVEAAKNYLEPVVYGYDASDAYEARCEETRRYETLKVALSKLEQP